MTTVTALWESLAPGLLPGLLVAGVALAALLVAWGATLILVRELRKRAILDHPNARSSHAAPTPRGGGWGVLAALLPAWGGLALWGSLSGAAAPWGMLASMAGLAAISWSDDRRGLPPLPRFLAQIIAVALGLEAIGLFAAGGLVFQGVLPPFWDRLGTALLWLWFVNLFNFMDGIDGIAGTEAAVIGTGLCLLTPLAGGVAILGPEGPGLALYGAALAGAALGFLWWNWQPARIFLGDVGSITLGYGLGWLLLAAAAAGAWAAALILPLYYLADATWTLGRRATRRQPVWQAHAEHFYQRAVRGGLSHAQAAAAVARNGAALVLLAALSAVTEGIATIAVLTAAVVIVAALLHHFHRHGQIREREK